MDLSLAMNSMLEKSFDVVADCDGDAAWRGMLPAFQLLIKPEMCDWLVRRKNKDIQFGIPCKERGY